MQPRSHRSSARWSAHAAPSSALPCLARQAGKDFYANFGCCFLDEGPITIGDRVILAPNVHLYPVGHSVDPALRSGVQGLEFAKPITICDDVWIGGGAIILPGERGRGGGGGSAEGVFPPPTSHLPPPTPLPLPRSSLPLPAAGVTIREGSSVGAGSVVTKDVEPYTVVAGNPARCIRRLERPQGAGA